jgi:hypothetical protein
MMLKKLDKKPSQYTIEIDIIKEDGSFECPECGKTISPDEPESEDTYQIADTIPVGDGLIDLVFICAKCKSRIKVQGIPTDIEA